MRSERTRRSGSAERLAASATIAAAVALTAAPARPATAEEPAGKPAGAPASVPGTTPAEPPADRPDHEAIIRDLGRILNGPEAESLPAEIVRMERLLRDIAGRPDASGAASEALSRARAALGRATRYRESGRAAAAERAEGIARAALVLAARLVTREQARQVLRAAERRAKRAEDEAATAREALQKAIEQREAARRALRGDEPATESGGP